MGADKYLRENVSLPDGAVEMLRDEFDAIYLAPWAIRACPPTSTPPTFFWAALQLDLYVNARPVDCCIRA